MLMWRTKLRLTINVSAEHETPPIENVLLAAAVLSLSIRVDFSLHKLLFEVG
jgi:hypothetical protein